MTDEFEPIGDDAVKMVRGRRERPLTTVKGYSKNRPHTGGQGRAGKRKALGWHKGGWRKGRRQDEIDAMLKISRGGKRG